MQGGDPLYYSEYLHLDRLLDCQHPESARRGEPAHDEMLFIIVHQAYELWFKQILHELETVLAAFARQRVDDREMGGIVARLNRVVEIQRILLGQLQVLETMTPLDFLDFRDHLIPASGFQSVQFRLIENKLGLHPRLRLPIGEDRYTARLRVDHVELLEASEAEPSLVELVDRWLARTPFLHFGDFDFWRAYRDSVDEMLARDRRAIEEHATLSDEARKTQLAMFEQTAAHFDELVDPEHHEALVAAGHRRLSHEAFLAALLINLYRDEPILQLPFRLLTALMDIDEGFTAWRYRHALMVTRMIGEKIGTGGTSGSDYLRRTADRHRVFRDLFELSTFFIPRSALPELPPEMEAKMGFRLGEPAL